MVDVQTQFVQVGERRVLVRHAGRGPALVLLHQSPQSSAALLPWVDRWAGRYAVFAPDTPGFGQSDPLPFAQPTIPDFAAALGALLQALALERVLLIGVHTGASIAARLAQDQPGRIAGLVCDGLALFTGDERQPLQDGYLPPFEPSWDGTHLLWLWARLREQTLFFPWHVGTAAARMAHPLAGTDKLQADTLDLLAAGDGYRAGYRAALLYDGSAAGAARLAVPALLLYREADVLRPHLDRHAALPAGVGAHAVADAEALAQRADAAWAAWGADASTVDAASQVAAAVSPRHRRVCGARGALAFLRAAGAGDGRAGGATVLHIGDIGVPARLPAASGGTALALELPGHGASDRRDEADLAPSVLAADVVAALDGLGALGVIGVIGDGHGDGAISVELQADGGSCALGVALAQALGDRCRGLLLRDPLPLAAAEAAHFIAALPALAPRPSGAHLIDAWNHARLAQLFWPWREPTANAAIRAAAPPPRQVHEEVAQMLRAGPNWAASWRAALAIDLAAGLQSLRCGLRIECRRGDAERERLASALAIAAGLSAAARNAAASDAPLSWADAGNA